MVFSHSGGCGITGGVTTKRLTSKKAPGKKAPSKKAPGKKAPIWGKGSPIIFCIPFYYSVPFILVCN